MKRYKYRRLTSIILAAVLLLSLTVPVIAAALSESTPKQEVVYINLNSDGSVSKIYVVNIFELTEDGRIIDYGDYTALRNMTTNDEIVFENETVIIDTKAGKLYYEGVLDNNTIPWIFTIRYYLDGAEYLADELAGKSGDLKITMAVRQNPDCNSSFFDHYALQASLTLDAKRCKNIIAEGATAANVGSDRQFTYTILPGTEMDVVITASVTDFEMNGISINGLPLSMDVEVDTENNAELNDRITDLESAVADLDNGANELKDGAIELQGGAGELKDGVIELQDGTNELYDSAVELRDGAAELYDGSLDLDSGIRELLEGAIELRDGACDLKDGAKELTNGIEEAARGALELFDGADELSSGADEIRLGATDLYNGLSTLTEQSGTLMNGAYTIFEQLTAQAQTQINASLEAAGMRPVTLTPKNYNAVITEILNALSGGAYSEAETALGANIRAHVEAAAAAQIEDTIRSDDDIMAWIEKGADDSWDDETKEQYVEAVISRLVAAQMAADEVQVQIDAAVAGQLSDGEVQSQISGAVNAALGGNAAYQGILSLQNQLDNYNAFYIGLKQYTAGVNEAASGAYSLFKGASTLANGAEELRSGAETLYDGLIKLQDGSSDLLKGTIKLRNGTLELYDGVIELKDGSIELLDGVIELYDGTITLYDGTVELKDGIVELLDGAIELYDGTVELYDGTIELTDGTFEFRDKTANLDKDLKDKINEAISNMLGKDFDVVSFVSDQNTNVESVQFVIKTPEIKNSETGKMEPVAEENLNFWQRLLRLFDRHGEQ